MTVATLATGPAAQIPPAVELSDEPRLRSVFLAQPIESVQANQTLFCEGEPAQHVFEVVDGVMCLYKMLPDGRRTITGFLYPGDIVGVPFRERYACTVEAVTPAKVRRHLWTRFHAILAERRELSQELYEIMCDELSAAQNRMVLLGRKNAGERVASFLIEVARKLRRATGDRSTRVALPMTRQDIADYLGLTIETVSRCITRLKTQGVISLVDAQRIVVQRLDDLCMLAGGDCDLPQVAVRPNAGRPH